MNEAERQRAVRGSIGATYLLKLPEDLAKRVRADARREGVSLAEWWRQAAEEMLRAMTKGKR
jgi:hypothetical protein